MTVLQSNMDALLVAVPMVALLFIGVFRLDELFGKSARQARQSKRVTMHRQLSGWDKDGRPICVDPNEKRRVRLEKSSRVV